MVFEHSDMSQHHFVVFDAAPHPISLFAPDRQVVCILEERLGKGRALVEQERARREAEPDEEVAADVDLNLDVFNDGGDY
jgi:hypothetical protein